MKIIEKSTLRRVLKLLKKIVYIIEKILDDGKDDWKRKEVL